jgi:signal transduction histidine kinase
MNFRLKTRIALFNTAAAAVVTILVFLVVFNVVYITSFHHLDSLISLEKEEIFLNIRISGDSIIPDLMGEWDEKEHQQADASPTFLQIVDAKGKLIFRSSNLQNDHLMFVDSLPEKIFLNVNFNGEKIRQGQFPIFSPGRKLLGQLVIGIPETESIHLISNLRLTLIIAFPLMLLVFYLATSWAASRGIQPINQLIRSTAGIGDLNISTRIPMPPHKDEIYHLANTINELLQRIEASLVREKQITADISHELRTPVTGIRGTLEVLIRKTREPSHYEEKILQVIRDVDALNRIIDQLLQLSRLESGNHIINATAVELNQLLQSIKERWSIKLKENHMQVLIKVSENVKVNADKGFLEIMLENILSNAIKYNNPGQNIICTWNDEENTLSVTDCGPGIPQDQIPYLFNRFYRTDVSRSSQIQGTGLGLSIVKTLADLQNITVGVISELNIGTTFTLKFNP